MENEGKLIKTIKISEGQRKRTTLGKVMFYDVLEIYENKVVGYSKGNKSMTWYFKEYIGIDIVKANMNSQFAQIVFLTGINSKNHFVGIDMSSSINHNIVNDTNRILFCSGMFSFKRTNEYTNDIGEEIKKAFDLYKSNDTVSVSTTTSSADEIRKYKELLDEGVITQEEFDSKKKQLLGL